MTRGAVAAENKMTCRNSRSLHGWGMSRFFNVPAVISTAGISGNTDRYIIMYAYMDI